jgi:hypothetical protein
MIAVDVPYLIERAGGPQALLNLLGKHSEVTPTYATVQMWGVRKTIPGKWSGLVLYVMAREHRMDIFEMTTDMDELADDVFA